MPLCLSGPGITVRSSMRDPITGVVSQGPEWTHRVMVASFAADMPARTKVNKGISAQASCLGCMWCWFAGVSVPGGGVVWLGNGQPSKAAVGLRSFDNSAPMQMGVDDSYRELTDSQHRARATYVESELDPAKRQETALSQGVHGWCACVPCLVAPHLS